MPVKLLWPLGLLLCSTVSWGQSHASETTEAISNFAGDVTKLKDYLNIPGMAVLVERDGEVLYEAYLGEADRENQIPVDTTTAFPIASITKVFTGVLLSRLQERGVLSLDDPIRKYLPEVELGDSVKLKHVLSHTSQGTPLGEHFYYNYRFGMLSAVMASATGRPFDSLLREEIFVPLRMEESFLLRDEEQVAREVPNLARPYILDEEGVQMGIVEYGFSAAAGIVSTPWDLLRFSRALDEGQLLDTAARERMYQPVRDGLPYGYGIFSQQVNERRVVWAYGQYDAYSSLLLKVPAENLTLILMANNNLLSNPARLIYGDLLYSRFAVSFLEHFLGEELTREKLLAEALSESFFARFDTAKLASSATLLRRVFAEYPDYLDYADLSLLHNLSFLKTVAFRRELGEFSAFDEPIERIGNHLLKLDPANPYANYYLGEFYGRTGEVERARSHFRTIVEAENFSRFWYTAEAEQWLRELGEK